MFDTTKISCLCVLYPVCTAICISSKVHRCSNAILYWIYCLYRREVSCKQVEERKVERAMPKERGRERDQLLLNISGFCFDFLFSMLLCPDPFEFKGDQRIIGTFNSSRSPYCILPSACCLLYLKTRFFFPPQHVAGYSVCQCGLRVQLLCD